jgi:hypothetical protein
MVVGPFAASTINLALNLWAFYLLIDFSKAAGMKKSLNYFIITRVDKWHLISRNIYYQDNLQYLYDFSCNCSIHQDLFRFNYRYFHRTTLLRQA